MKDFRHSQLKFNINE